ELPQPMDPAEFANPVVKNSYALAAKVKRCSTSSRAIATATAASATRAFWTASRANMDRAATSAWPRPCTLSSRPKKARRPHRSAKQSKRANGGRSTLRNTRPIRQNRNFGYHPVLFVRKAIGRFHHFDANKIAADVRTELGKKRLLIQVKEAVRPLEPNVDPE